MNRIAIFRGLAAAAAVLGIASSALAGAVYSYPVYIGTSYFSGALGSAHHSANSVEYIYCSDYGDFALCAARDASWAYRSCLTTDPGHLTAIRSLSDSDYVSLYHDASGDCTDISVRKGSHYEAR